MSSDIAERFDRLESRVDTLSELLVDNDGELEELEREVAGLRQSYEQRIADLEHEVTKLNQSLGLIEQAAAAEASSTEARAAICLQTLVNKAQSNGGRATMDAGGVLDALNGNCPRPVAYDVLRAVARACDATTFVKEDAAADRNTRVELEMEHGETHFAEIGGQVVSVSLEEV